MMKTIWKRIMTAILLCAALLSFAACGSKTCAICGKTFSGAGYRNVITEGGGVLCPDCAEYYYGTDIEWFAN